MGQDGLDIAVPGDHFEYVVAVAFQVFGALALGGLALYRHPMSELAGLFGDRHEVDIHPVRGPVLAVVDHLHAHGLLMR